MRGHWYRLIKPQSGHPLAGMYRLDQSPLSRRQQLREHREIAAAGGAKPERGAHINADHMSAGRQPQLALAGEQRVPGFMFLEADQGVLAIGAEPSVSSGLASGTGQVVVSAGTAIFRAPARLEVPATEGPDNDMDASR
jgi:hypothetical protein